MTKRLFFIFSFGLFLQMSMYAAVCTNTVTGNWLDPATWSCGRVPTCGDAITIAAGTTVTVNNQVDLTTGTCADPSCQSVSITVAGTLYFQTGKKLTICDNSTITFSGAGQIVPQNPSGNNNLITVGTTPVWNSGTGTINASTNPGGLPVTWLSFTAEACAGKVCLNWATASEKFNKYFTIENSSDLLAFNEIGNVNSKAPDGNSIITLTYNFTDNSPKFGTSYYRLKQVDYNGAFDYSKIAQVTFSTKSGINFYPNPAHNAGTLVVGDDYINANVSITDLLGREIKNFTMSSSSKNIDFSEINAGIYTILLNTENASQKIKIIIQK